MSEGGGNSSPASTVIGCWSPGRGGGLEGILRSAPEAREAAAAAGEGARRGVRAEEAEEGQGAGARGEARAQPHGGAAHRREAVRVGFPHRGTHAPPTPVVSRVTGPPPGCLNLPPPLEVAPWPVRPVVRSFEAIHSGEFLASGFLAQLGFVLKWLLGLFDRHLS